MNSSVMRRTDLLAVLVLFLAHSAPAAGGKRTKSDTLSRKTHEQYLEEQFERQPLEPIKPPILHPPGPQSIFPNIDISQNTSPQNEPSVRISHKDPNRVLAAWRDFRTGVTPAVRRVGYSFSTDGGATWGPTGLLPLFYGSAGFTRNSDPAVCVDTEGNFYIATIALNDNNGDLKNLVFKSSPVGDFFGSASFAPTDTADGFYDKEYIVCDLTPSSPFVNNLYIAWSTGLFTRSTDGGTTWSSSVTTRDSGGFWPDLCVGPDGSVNVISGTGNAVWFDKSTDGGISFGLHSVVADSIYFIAPHVGRATFPSIACDVSDGPRRGYLYAVWSDTTYGDADIFLGISRDGGHTWSIGRRVNDDAKGNGKDQYWPWIRVDDRGVVSIVYYDTRNTPDPSYFEVYHAYSWDGGLTFTNRLISTAQSPRNQPNGDVRFGDYIGIDSWGKHTVPVWTDERAGGFDMSIYTALLDTLPFVSSSGVNVTLATNWNMVSLPVLPSGSPLASVFPTRSSPAFAYTGVYEVRDTLDIGSGYWVRFGSDQTIRIIGDTLTTDSINVSEGWNLVGSITNPVPVSSVSSEPPGLIVSRFFDYGGHYRTPSTITPGMAYWVKTSGAGRLILSSAPAKQAPIPVLSELDQLNTFTVTDRSGVEQRLYFGSAKQNIDPTLYELPPLPPESVFDVRYATGRMVELAEPAHEREMAIRISSGAYPLSVHWKLNESGEQASLKVDGRIVSMEGTGGSVIRQQPSELRLRWSGTPQNGSLPRVYSISQNYPNPFNPETQIEYALPEDVHVRLDVYDLLGKRVDVLVDEDQKAGFKSARFDAKGLPSGVYYYRLTAGLYTGVRKMLVLR